MKHQPPEVRERFAQRFVGDVVISAAQKSNRSALESLLEDIKVAPFDAQAAMAYGPIRATYKDRNRDALDQLIATQAIALGVTRVTNIEADFLNYAGLRAEDWVSSH